MRKIRCGLLLFLAVGLAAGCHRSLTPGRASGHVKYKGQPVKGGTISFHSENMGSAHSMLSPEGTYEVVDMPVGTMTVTIETESMNPDKKAPGYPGAAGGRAVVGAGAAKASAMDKQRLEAERKAGVAAPPSSADLRARYVKIPKKYADRSASPLKADIVAGQQTIDFDLTD